MTDHNTEQRQAWLKSLQPKNVALDILATALGATAILFALFI
jgi:hypothetical protein